MSTAIVIRLLPEDAVPKRAGDVQRRQRHRGDDLGPARKLSRRPDRLARRLLFVVPLALLALVGQWISMPSLPPRRAASRAMLFRPLMRPPVAYGMTAIFLLFMGQFALFTYLRPFLEGVAGFSVPALSLVFLADGRGGRRRHLVHQPAAGRAPLFDRHRHPAGDGRDCRLADRAGLHARSRLPSCSSPGASSALRRRWVGERG